MNHIYRSLFVLFMAVVMASCGTQRAALKSGSGSGPATGSEAQRQLAFVQKVYDQQLYQQNVVAKLTFTVNTGGKSISVPAQLRMRRGDVVRLQVQMPLLGTELGRLEFTKDYVLIVDRYHHQYVKGDYNQVDFLKANGINFNSLQALFWNCLFVPGSQTLNESQLKEFGVDLNASSSAVPVTLKRGKMSYVWTVNPATSLIGEVLTTYVGGDGKRSQLDWKYSDFRSFGSKKYPFRHEFTINSDALKKSRKLTVTLELNKVTADSDWDTRTTLTDRYKEVSPEEVLGKLMSM